MKVEAIKTRALVPPQDDLFEAIRGGLEKMPEKSILVVTSKVVAIHQGRCIKIAKSEKGKAKNSRDELAKQEADWYIDRDVVPGEHIMISIKENILIASAGIDKSNAKEHFVLWPEDLPKAAREIQGFLKKEYKVDQVGVIITDSHITPMKRGVVGVALSHFGFNPLRDYRGRKDVFGRELVVTMTNMVEPLAAAAVMEMGEGAECTPLALVTDVEQIEFTEDEEINKGKPDMNIPMAEDLFGPILAAVKWKKGKGGIKKIATRV